MREVKNNLLQLGRHLFEHLPLSFGAVYCPLVMLGFLLKMSIDPEFGTGSQFNYFFSHIVGWNVAAIAVAIIPAFTVWFVLVSFREFPFFSVFLIALNIPMSFAFVYFGLQQSNQNCISDLSSVEDAIYFSITTFTTLGYGDMSPIGSCRLITSLQALLGLLTIGAIPSIVVSSVISGK